MGRHGFLPVTPFSAAQSLAQWTLEHGRPPTYIDCRGSGGLMWYTTYYKCFEVSSFSAVLTVAFALVSAGNSALSEATVRKLKPCLNAPTCPALIVDEGHHIRFCSRCRAHQAQHQAVDESYFVPALSTRTLVRLRMDRHDWASELADLSEL